MPFTFSHPAIVLPLTFIDKKRYSVTALTIGSITPDFEYFLNFEPRSIYSHTWLGVFWYDLPLSIILFYLFNTLVKDELIDSLPPFLNSRFARFKNLKRIKYSTQKCLIVLTSLLIGITSHLFWDKLTHRSVQLVEYPVEFYTFFWDGSSVVGAAAIAFMIWKMPKATIAIKHDNFFFWFVLLSVILLVTIIRSAYTVEVRHLGVAAISAFFIGLLVASIINKVRHKRQAQQKWAHCV